MTKNPKPTSRNETEHTCDVTLPKTKTWYAVKKINKWYTPNYLIAGDGMVDMIWDQVRTPNKWLRVR